MCVNSVERMYLSIESVALMLRCVMFNRLEFSTQASKKKHSGQQAHRQLSRRTSISRSVTASQSSNDDMPLEFSTATTLTLEGNKYLSRIHTVGVKETFTAQSETNRQSVANRRRRRHHRRR